MLLHTAFNNRPEILFKGNQLYYSHFTDCDAEAQSSEVICQVRSQKLEC